MKNSKISVVTIPQLKDNYSYILKSSKTNEAIVVDPAESKSILNYLNKNNLKLLAILITHKHNDHTAGIKGIIKSINIPVYSPSADVYGTSNIVKDNDEIDFKFISIKVKTTPGHTLDHVIFFSEKNNILFSGDTLFRLGCGRIFEGTYETMYKSLKYIENLNDDLMVYCGHEYTINNLNFLKSVFPDHQSLKIMKEQINNQLTKTKSSIPFNLGEEKNINPFLSSKSIFYDEYKKSNKLSNFEMFCYLRELKDKF